jgi:hypothetical protein
MNRRKKGLFVCLFVMLLGWPQPAQARDIWDVIAYLHELSGPGPFNGGVVALEVFCREAGSPVGACTGERDAVSAYGVVEYAHWDDDPNPRFTGNVAIESLQGILYVHGHSVPGIKEWKRATGISFGAGLGFYRIHGSGVQEGSLTRFSIPLRLRVTPNELFHCPDRPRTVSRKRLALNAISYHIGLDILPQGFSETAFVASPPYSSGAHAQWTNALVVDILGLVTAVTHRP